MKKILLDENLPKPLKRHFSGDFNVTTVSDKGWNSLENGELLEAMSKEGFEILLTVDKNLQYQQNLNKYSIQIVVLFTINNRYKTLLSKVPLIESKIRKIRDSDKVFIIDLRK